jgi:hypothetical protein
MTTPSLMQWTPPRTPTLELECFVPDFDGAFLSSDSKDALWDGFYTGAHNDTGGARLRAVPASDRQQPPSDTMLLQCWGPRDGHADADADQGSSIYDSLRERTVKRERARLD